MAKNDKGNIQSGDFNEALALLTRLPVTSDSSRGIHAAWAWPLAGAVVAVLAGITAKLALMIGLPFAAAAGLALTAQIMLTGALHEDGLADCADGFWGGSTQERRLEIMKDSAIGTYGTLALVLSVLLRWSLLTALFATGSVFGPLLAIAALSRVPMVALMFEMQPARSEGLSAGVGRPSIDTLILAAAAGLLTAFIFAGFAAIPAALVIAGSGLGLRQIAIAKIGGQTGDVLGASQQIAEIIGLMVLVWAYA